MTMKGSERARMSPQEERLRRMIIAYTASEARKEIKWEINRGADVQSEEATEVLMDGEAKDADAEVRARLTQDFLRKEAWLAEHETVVVARTEDCGAKVSSLTFDPSPPDKTASNTRLLNSILKADRLLLIRNRIESRLRQALSARSGRVTSTTEALISTSNTITCLELPVSSVTVVRLRSGVPEVEVDSDLDLHTPLALFRPFQFRVKSYTVQPLLEHPFVSAEQGEEVEFSRPGDSREAEVEEVKSQWAVEHFSSPPGWEVHYPTVPTPFLQQAKLHVFPHSVAQRADPSSARPDPHRDESFAAELTPTYLATSTSVFEVMRKPAPELMKIPKKEDILSDTEDDEGHSAKWEKPAGLRSIASLPWLTGLGELFAGGNGGEEGEANGGDESVSDDVVRTTVLPVHSHDKQITNPAVAEKLVEYDALIESLLVNLTPRLRKIV